VVPLQTPGVQMTCWLYWHAPLAQVPAVAQAVSGQSLSLQHAWQLPPQQTPVKPVAVVHAVPLATGVHPSTGSHMAFSHGFVTPQITSLY
jgi:hypothetical protein